MSVYVPGHVKGGHYHFDFWFHGRRFRGSTGCTRKEDAERF